MFFLSRKLYQVSVNAKVQRQVQTRQHFIYATLGVRSESKTVLVDGHAREKSAV